MAKESNTKPAVQRSRRKLLGVLSAGAAVAKLPGTWSKPAVASVILPAHASTSPPPSPCLGGELLIANSNQGGGSVSVGLVGSVTLPGGGYYANFTYPGGTRQVSLDTISPGTYAATLNPVGSFTEAYCPGPVLVGVRFYPMGSPGDFVCSFYDTISCTATV